MQVHQETTRSQKCVLRVDGAEIWQQRVPESGTTHRVNALLPNSVLVSWMTAALVHKLS